MDILCKHKDFYDFRCFEYGRDTFPVFDRRNCIVLDQNLLTRWVFGLQLFSDNPKVFFYLEVGFDKYVFSAFDKIESEKSSKLLPMYDCSFEFIRVIKNAPKIWPAVMALSRIYEKQPDINKLSRKEAKQYYGDKKRLERHIATLKIDEIDFGNNDKKYFPEQPENIVALPILCKTKLSGLLDSLEIYKSLDNYLRSFHNEVDQVSCDLTDEQKVESKGFHKKESFRNIHPRSK